VLGYDSFAEWLAAPEIDLGYRQSMRLIESYREMVVERGVSAGALELADVTKVAVVLPAVKRGDVSAEDALSDAQTLSRSDLEDKYRHSDPNAPLDAGAEEVARLPRLRPSAPGGAMRAPLKRCEMTAMGRQRAPHDLSNAQATRARCLHAHAFTARAAAPPRNYSRSRPGSRASGSTGSAGNCATWASSPGRRSSARASAGPTTSTGSSTGRHRRGRGSCRCSPASKPAVKGPSSH
jgi:hypothetical protein